MTCPKCYFLASSPKSWQEVASASDRRRPVFGYPDCGRPCQSRPTRGSHERRVRKVILMILRFCCPFWSKMRRNQCFAKEKYKENATCPKSVVSGLAAIPDRRARQAQRGQRAQRTRRSQARLAKVSAAKCFKTNLALFPILARMVPKSQFGNEQIQRKRDLPKMLFFSIQPKILAGGGQCIGPEASCLWLSRLRAAMPVPTDQRQP